MQKVVGIKMNDTNEITQVSGSASFLGDFIWKNAEDLWGDFKHTDFGKIILLPLTHGQNSSLKTHAPSTQIPLSFQRPWPRPSSMGSE